MADKTLQCSIITPEGKAFEGPATEVVIPAHDGQIGILHDRAPLVCKLGAGSLRVDHDGTSKQWFVDGGFCQVVENKVTVLTQHSLKPDELNIADAEQQLADANAMTARDDIDAKRKAHMADSARAKLRMLRS